MMSLEKFKNQSQKAASFMMAKVASKNISDLRAELDSKQDLLAKVMSKKPKSLMKNKSLKFIQSHTSLFHPRGIISD